MFFFTFFENRGGNDDIDFSSPEIANGLFEFCSLFTGLEI